MTARIPMPDAIVLRPGDFVIVAREAGGQIAIHPVETAGLRVIADERLKYLRLRAKQAREVDPTSQDVRFALYRMRDRNTLEKIR